MLNAMQNKELQRAEPLYRPALTHGQTESMNELNGASCPIQVGFENSISRHTLACLGKTGKQKPSQSYDHEGLKVERAKRFELSTFTLAR